MSLVIVNSAVDSLYFYYKGEIDAGFYRYLENLKEAAAVNEEEIAFEMGTEPLFMKEYGAGMFRYNIRGQNFFLKVSPSDKLPNFMFQMLAVGLYQLGYKAAFNTADSAVKSIGDPGEAKISRIDLCADFQGWQIKGEYLDNFVCRANQDNAWRNGKKTSGFQFGKGKVLARIYDKTKEIQVHNKGWMEAVWQECPQYDQTLPVWRVEFQYKREALKEFGIDTVADAFEKLAGLWKYGLDWLSLRTGNESRIERRPVDENWQALELADFSGIEATRVRKTKALCDMERALAQLIGYSSSLGAIWNMTKLEHVLSHAITEMTNKCENQGVTFEERVLKKIQLMKYEQF